MLAWGPPLLLWAAVLYKLPALRRRPRDRGLQAYWLTLLYLALALTLLLPPVYFAMSQLTGVPNLARLLGNGLGLASSWTVQAFLFHLSDPHGRACAGVKRSGWALAGTLGAMTVLFVLAPVEETVIDFTRRYGDAPFVFEYRLAFLAYLGLATVNVARLSWRYAQIADRPSLQLGLRLVAAGGLVGLAYVVHEGTHVTARRLGLGYPVPAPATVTEILIVTAVLLFVVGSTMPAWGPRLGIPRVYRWMRQHRSLRRLYPLWRALCQASPEIALDPPTSRLADVLAVRDLGFRLYRRVVEIRDGRLALRPYHNPRAAELARRLGQTAGLADEELEALVEATRLAAALQAKAWGHTVDHTVAEIGTPGGADVTGEVVVLERVADHYAHSPIVRMVLTPLAEEHTASGSHVSHQEGRS
jgi:hypothetical protein